MLNYHKQDLTVDEHFEIRKQYALEEPKEPEPEPKAKTKTVSKLTEGLGLTEAGIKVVEDIGLNEQRTATIQGIMRMLACYEVIQKEKERPLSRQSSVLNCVKSSSETCASPSVLDMEGIIQTKHLQIKKKVRPP